MLDWSVCDGELSEIMADHFGLDFNLRKLLALVDTNDTANHLRYHNHIPQVCLDEVGLLVRFGFLLRFAQLLDQTHGLSLETTVEPTPGASVNDISQLFGGQVKELVEIDATVREFAEGSLLLQFYRAIVSNSH